MSAKKRNSKYDVAFYNGEEWCDNAKGLEVYPALISFIHDKITAEPRQRRMNPRNRHVN